MPLPPQSCKTRKVIITLVQTNTRYKAIESHPWSIPSHCSSGGQSLLGIQTPSSLNLGFTGNVSPSPPLCPIGTNGGRMDELFDHIAKPRHSQNHHQTLLPMTASQFARLLPNHQIFPSMPIRPHSASHRFRVRRLALRDYQAQILAAVRGNSPDCTPGMQLC